MTIDNRMAGIVARVRGRGKAKSDRELDEFCEFERKWLSGKRFAARKHKRHKKIRSRRTEGGGQTTDYGLLYRQFFFHSSYSEGLRRKRAIFPS